MLKKWTEEEILFLKENYYSLEAKKLSASLGRSISSIRTKFSKLGLCKLKKWSKKDSEYLIKNYDKKTLEEIAHKLKCCSRTIFEKSKILQLKPDYRHCVSCCNDTLFDENNWNPTLAYIVGLVLADGHVSNCNIGYSVSIELCDRDVIYKLKNITEHKTGIYSRKLKSGKTSYRIVFSGRKVWQFFTALGMGHNKSHTAIWPIGLPSEYTNHFLRGLFDGDGCITLMSNMYPRVSIVGTEKVIKETGTVFVDYNTMQKHVAKSSWVIYYNGVKAINFLNYIYQGSTKGIRMDRKYTKHLKALKWTGREKNFDKSN